MLKKLVCFFICFVSVLNTLVVSASSASLSLSAASAALMNVSTGEIIYEKNAYKERGIASTTKIMTSLVALEYGALHDTVKVKAEDVAVEGTSIGLKAGDIVNLDVLVKGMLLESGNDAANVTATLVSGNKADFIDLMNKKADELGMKSTSFANPSGLTEENHYSTAYDMCLLGCAAVKNKYFTRICSSSSLRVSYNSSDTEKTFYNHNKFLKKFDGAFGIKTGFTKASGRCLVTAAQRNGVTLVAVTLNAYDDWNDHIKLMEYGFENVKRINVDFDTSHLKIPVVGSEMKAVGVELTSPLYFSSVDEKYPYDTVVYLEKFLYPTVKKGECVGRVDIVSSSGSILARSYLVSNSSAEPLKVSKDENNSGFFRKFISKIRKGLSLRQT